MVGDAVLLQNDSTKRTLWKLAVVEECLPKPDGRIKAAVVKVADSKKLLKTSVKHLFPIEVKSQVDILPQRERSAVQSTQRSNLVVAR